MVLEEILQLLSVTSAEKVADMYFEKVAGVKDDMLADADFFLSSDPAAHSLSEIILAYPGFYAIAIFRLASQMQELGVPLLPRIFTEHAHSKTGIDIHPGAQIGVPFFIDHGTGVVIGETTKIGQRVKMYQGVTLGALAVSKEVANQKRHPTVEDDVVLYAGCCILGGQTVIGKGAVIGGNAWVTASIPAQQLVLQNTSIEVLDKKILQSVINFTI